MIFIREIEKDSDDVASITNTPEGLFQIYQQGCAAAIWHRVPLKSFQWWIDRLPSEKLPQTRTILQPGAVRRAMYELCQTSKLPEAEHRTRLIDDISALANIFADLTEAPYLRLRLEVVSTDACRKFHKDSVTTRLVCTYRGPGTQYGTSRDGGDPQQIHTVGTGSPILLRGTLSSGITDASLLHRSPPIEGTGASRLVLVLDPIAASDDDLNSHKIH